MKDTNPVYPVILSKKNYSLAMNHLFMAGIIFIFSLASQLFAQSHISFNHLTVEDGLSQSSVTCILQDSKGFMWFGTQDGLNKYDGYSFKIFKTEIGNIPNNSLTHFRV